MPGPPPGPRTEGRRPDLNEHPIFVPFGGDHIAAIVTAPDGPPRALVLLLPGLGAPRSHKYGLWARAARSLAERGIASVRMDYPGIGDSTGQLGADLRSAGLDEAVAVARMAREALGVDVVGAVGNCLGARIALGLAGRLDGCVSVGCVLSASPKAILQGRGRTAPGRAIRRQGRRTPRLRRLVKRFVLRQGIPLRYRFMPEMAGAVRSANVLLLLLAQEDARGPLEEALAATVAGAGREPGRRSEVRLIPAVGTSGFRLSIDLQQRLIDALVGWMDQTLPGLPRRRVALEGRAV